MGIGYGKNTQTCNIKTSLHIDACCQSFCLKKVVISRGYKKSVLFLFIPNAMFMLQGVDRCQGPCWIASHITPPLHSTASPLLDMYVLKTIFHALLVRKTSGVHLLSIPIMCGFRAVYSNGTPSVLLRRGPPQHRYFVYNPDCFCTPA